MELRSLLTSGQSVALGVLALRAVQSALTPAMPTGGDSPPMGWTPMPDPADGGVGSPPFPVNLTAEERAHLEAFDVLDFASARPAPAAGGGTQNRTICA